MQRANTVDEYILNTKSRQDILIILHDLLVATELSETIKWGAPCYTINGKNVIGLAAFKAHVAIWFFQGALLKDDANVLINAQEDKTKALRQLRFQSADEIDAELLMDYIEQAIENEKQHKRVKITRSKSVIIAQELKDAFEEDAGLKMAFKNLTPGKQREFSNYVMGAKQEKTRQSRLDKIIPMIKQNIGLSDKYRNH